MVLRFARRSYLSILGSVSHPPQISANPILAKIQRKLHTHWLWIWWSLDCPVRNSRRRKMWTKTCTKMVKTGYTGYSCV